MTAAYKASAEQLIMEQMFEKTFMTGNVRDNCYPHIRLLPTHSRLAFANFIRLLPFATSAHPQIHTSAHPLITIATGFTDQNHVKQGYFLPITIIMSFSFTILCHTRLTRQDKEK